MHVSWTYVHRKKRIIPQCYNDLLLEAGESERNHIPIYIELMDMLDIPKLSIMTIFRWLKYLWYIYNEKNAYYTDGHEREDVVNDRITHFLVQYFLAKRRTYRWIHTPLDTAQNLMREYHVYIHPIILNYVDENKSKYGEILVLGWML